MSLYRHIDNWHKHPWISPILCWIGRHDYEVEKSTGHNSAMLYCFYCGRKKHSANSSNKEE